MRIKLDKGAYPLERVHSTDAGLDIRALNDGRVPAHGSKVFHTGVHVQLPHGTMGNMRSKSGLMFKHGITSDGIVDEGYSDEIMVKLFNHSDKDYYVSAGDKISQLIITPVLYENVEVVDEIESGERGNNGFGSTGYR